MLAAIRSTRPSPPEHGSTPACSARAAASKSTAAITAPTGDSLAEFHRYFQEILAVKPRAVPDQQLNRCLRG